MTLNPLNLKYTPDTNGGANGGAAVRSHEVSFDKNEFLGYKYRADDAGLTTSIDLNATGLSISS